MSAELAADGIGLVGDHFHVLLSASQGHYEPGTGIGIDQA
jgi:hypothetical protein